MNPVVGFRVWSAAHGRLYPWAMRFKDREWTASTVADVAPTDSNPNGLHGWYVPAWRGACPSRDSEGVAGEAVSHAGTLVVGAFIAWGKVVFQEEGIRAEKGRPVVLRRPGKRPTWPTAPEQAVKAAQRLSIPLVDTDDALLAIASEYGDLIAPETIAA